AWLFREALAVSLAAQADIRNAAQRSREAEEPAREAAALALEQLRDFPNYPMARRNYARHLWTLANTLSFLRRHEEAEQIAAEALDVAAGLDEDLGGVPFHRLLVAETKLQMGTCCKNTRRFAEAERWHAEAFTLLLQLLLDNPQDATCHELYCNALADLRGL